MTIQTFIENGFKVTIDYDQSSGSDSPRDWENATVFVLSHPKYNWPDESPLNLDNYNGWDEVTKALIEDEDAAAVWPVYAYIHSGTAFRLGASITYGDQWDSGIAGLIYVTRKSLDFEWTGTEEEKLQKAKECAELELEVYDQWCNGQVYGYVIQDFDGEEVDSLWGMYGLDYCESEARSSARRLEHEKKCNGTLNRVTGEIDHKTECEIHS